MPLQLTGAGAGDTTAIPPDFGGQLNGRIVLNGNRNRLVLGPNSVSGELNVELGEECVLRVGANCNLGNLFIYAARGAEIVIGAGSSFNGRVRLLLHEPGRIVIGDGCLLASGVDVTISDMHSLVDAATGQRLNPARDVFIGDRVWVGQNAMVLKGSYIEAGSVIGAAAVVTGRIPGNVVAAGVPARVLREGVTWRQDLI